MSFSLWINTCTPTSLATLQLNMENVDKAAQLLEVQGHTVERRGQMAWPDRPWFEANPDGILDSTRLLDIKCPSSVPCHFLGSQIERSDAQVMGSMSDFPVGRVGCSLQMQLRSMCVELQSWKLVTWTLAEQLDISFDKYYTDGPSPKCLIFTHAN